MMKIKQRMQHRDIITYKIWQCPGCLREDSWTKSVIDDE